MFYDWFFAEKNEGWFNNDINIGKIPEHFKLKKVFDLYQ